MNIYSMAMPRTEFASYTTRGSYDLSTMPCEKCSRCIDNSRQSIVAPYKIMFIPSNTTELGDFAYDKMAYPELVVSVRVKDYFESKGYPCTFSLVEVLPPEKKRNVLPYPVNIPLYFMDCTVALPIKLEKSGLLPTPPCPVCGVTTPLWNKQEQVFVQGNPLEYKIFRLHPYEDRGIYVTEQFVEELVAQGFTNMSIQQLRLKGKMEL